MKKGKIKTEYIILGIIILLLAYLILKNPDKIHYELPEINSIDKEDITKIDIIKPGETINLVRKEKKWFIGPHNYPTNKTKIDKILDLIGSFRLSALVSESKNYSIYGLDKDNKIAVKVYKKNQVLREFEIGKAVSTYRHTFVRLSKDKNVYHARSNFRSDFNLKIDDLRDKVVMKFDKNEISEIYVTKDKIQIHFVKNIKPAEVKPGEKKDKNKSVPPKDDVTWVNKDGKTGNKDKLDSIINQLSNLSCDQFIEDKSKDDLKDPIYTLLLRGSKDYSIHIFKKLEKDSGKYPAVSSENPYPFLLSSNKAKSIMGKPEDLIKNGSTLKGTK